MGLFGWHKCGEPGCDATLFVPLFAADGSYDGAREEWQRHLAEKAQWNAVDGSDQSAVGCPAHKPATKEGER